jgi:mono/diheme cytochrome c family protein
MTLGTLRGMAFLLSTTWAAAGVPGDAQRGEQVLRDQKCLTCHTAGGSGSGTAPDLGRRGSRAYTPSLMVSLMWNHAPRMWTAMDRAGVARPNLSEQDSADLFAYFYSLRYFESLGDGGRGKAIFRSKRCSDCHATGNEPAKEGPAVESWPAVENPVELARAMWNHAPKMMPKMRERGMEWPTITGSEMTDLTVYLSSLTRKRSAAAPSAAATPADGKEVFENRGCSGCHHGDLDLATGLRTQRRTFATLAAGMWNHAPKMLQMPPEISSEEMRGLVGHLWSNQYFEDPGRPVRGESLFAKKGCAGCHGSGAAPNLLTSGRKFDSLSMASSLWKHGPAMLAEIQKMNLRWPRFENREMQDVIAYLNSGRK